MAKNSKPQTANPLAGMGLDEIVRSMTTETPSNQSESEETSDAAKTEDAAQKEEKTAPKRRRGSIKTLEENISKYKGLNEQGFAIWLPKEVKKRLEMIRLNAERTIPLRALASAIIMTYIQENEDKLNQL